MTETYIRTIFPTRLKSQAYSLEYDDQLLPQVHLSPYTYTSQS